jgi:hypothetical protein
MPNAAGRGIAFLSFTNAAVSELELKLRHEGLLPSPAFPHFIGTFDSFIWQFLVVPFGIPGCVEAPRLVPDKDSRVVQPFETARPLRLSFFDRFTGAVIPALARQVGFDVARSPAATKAYETLARRSRERFLARGELDFTDARIIANDRLKDMSLSAKLAGAFAARFREVIVDEAQDCNPADLEIIDWLRKAGIATKVVCDPHQSIYQFRGGVTEHLFAFGKSFDAKNRLPMNGNFRSSHNICRAIVTLRALNAQDVIDRALGDHRFDPTPIYVFAYPGVGVPTAVGRKFHEVLETTRIDVAESPVLAATRSTALKAIGQPSDPTTQDMTMRLALAIMGFQFAFEIGNRISALEEVHKIVLEIEGRMDGKTYHQYIVAEGIEANTWRPRILRLVRELRYDPSVYANADVWLSRAKALLAPHLPPGGPSISQRLRRNAALKSVLSPPPPSGPPARTIHSVKGMQFPAVCVVMTAATAGAILDYLETGYSPEAAESAREIYVAASRAQRLLAFAAPRSQAARLAGHIGRSGAQVTLTTV